MDNEQTEQRLLQRGENYKRRKEKEKGNEVELLCTNDIVEPNVPNLIFTAMNFSNTHFQETYDNKTESSTIHINDPTVDLNNASTFQGTHDNESEYDELEYFEPKYGNSNAFVEYIKYLHLLCCGLFKNMLDVEILTRSNAGKIAFLPIIKLKTNVSSRLPFMFSRK
uniref:Uncharacterized protein n=1 Tax=Medicago truncatula TaxID=3880 RepID=A4PSE4_MEDTR|nr:hypothetical protein MtrDRAFT_AC140550g36v2 [Medicago truncatula]